MSGIIFFDTEIHTETKKILDIGAVCSDGAKLHNPSPKAFTAFGEGHRYVWGHNIVASDLQYMNAHIAAATLVRVAFHLSSPTHFHQE